MPRKQIDSRPDPAEPDDLAPAFARLKQAAENLPEVEPGLSYGTPALRVGKKLLCRIKDADTAVLMCDLEEKEMLMASAPNLFFETDHYKGWPALLVRVHDISAEELAHRLRRAWLRAAPKKLVKAWQQGTGTPEGQGRLAAQRPPRN